MSREPATPETRIGQALCDRLGSEFGGTVRLTAPVRANGKGFDSDIYFVQVTGESLPPAWREPLVLRVKPSPGAIGLARYEAAVQDWASDRGYPTPRILQVFDAGELSDRPVQAMERAAGDIVIDRIVRRPWRARGLLQQMATLQARLHSLDPSGFPAGDDLLDKRLLLTRATAGALDHAGLHAGLDRIGEIAEELRDAPGVACHGDFHPLNVLVSDVSMQVIDWSDGGVGDRHGDLARTLLLYTVAHIAASSAVERAVFRLLGPVLGRMHRAAYERVLPVEERRLALWTPVHLLHGWSQAVGAHAGIFDDGDTRDASAERIPLALVDELELRFGVAMAAVS